jgi:pseudouridine-5'-phosphate glycosidase
LPLEWRVDTPAQAAQLVRQHRELQSPGAIVLAQPVESELAVDRKTMDTAVREALKRAEQAGIQGKTATPFLLDVVSRLTEGRAQRANQALVVANARLAAEIAAELRA